MKKLLILLLLLLPLISFGALTVPQGGTGTSTFQSGWIPMGSTTLRLTEIASTTWGFITKNNTWTGQNTFTGTTTLATTTVTYLTVPDYIVFDDTNLNMMFGYQAGKNITVGTQGNIFIGYLSGFSTATTSTDANYNTAIGAYSLYSNTSGYENLALGGQALISNTTGYLNTAVGDLTLFSNTTGRWNTAIGAQALVANNGVHNTAVGVGSLTRNTGNYNTSLGDNLSQNVTGSYNVAIGDMAGDYEMGSNSFYVDSYDRDSSAGDKAGALLYGTFNATPANQTLTINASTTLPSLTISGLNSSFLAVNQSGKVIATTSPLLSYTETDPFYSLASSTLLRFGTTTDALTEGTNNLFWTNTRFDTRLSATTSLPSLATLTGLTTIGLTTSTTSVAGDLKVGTQTLYVNAVGGLVGIGTTSPSYQLEITNDGTNTKRGVSIDNHVSAVGGALLWFEKSRGTKAVPTIVADQDIIGNQLIRVYDGTQYLTTAGSGFVANGTMTAGSIPTDIFFSTQATGGVTALVGERMRITSGGLVGIGTSSPNAKLGIAGTLGATTDLFNVSSTTASNVVSSLFKVAWNGLTTIKGMLTVTATTTISSGSTHTNNVVCYLANGALGYCSSVVGIDGTCTCNPN